MTYYKIKTTYGFLSHQYDKLTDAEKVAKEMVQRGAVNFAFVYAFDIEQEFILGFDESCRNEVTC